MDDNEVLPDPDNSDEVTESSSKLPLVAIIIGVIGIIVGVTAIVIANQAVQEADSLRDQLARQPDPQQTVQAQIEEAQESLARTVRTNADRLGDVEQRVSGLVSQAQQGFKTIHGEVTTNRKQISELSSQLQQLAEAVRTTRNTGARPQPQRQQPTATSETGTAVPAEEEPAGETAEALSPEGIYRIQPGDTLMKVANRYGTTVDAIMQANPGIDPYRLQVGQQILLPQE